MIINERTGQIAYHALRFREHGGIEVVQYDYDGSELNRPLRDEERFIPPKTV